MMKLTQEQRETLYDLVNSGEWDTVMALCAIGVENHQSRLCTTDISKPQGQHDLFMAKAKLEGALDIQRLLGNAREHMSNKKKEKE